MKAEKIDRFTAGLQKLMMKMQEVGNVCCMEVTSDVSKREFSLLVYMGDTGGLIMKEIADFLQVPMSTATGIVDKLVEKNYLVRHHSEEDRRIVKVGLSKYGQEVYGLFRSRFFQFGNAVLSNLSDTEQDQFIRFLEKATSSITKNPSIYAEN